MATKRPGGQQGPPIGGTYRPPSGVQFQRRNERPSPPPRSSGRPQPGHPRGPDINRVNATRYDPDGAISDLLGDIAAQYDAELAKIKASYAGRGGGGGGGGYASAIAEIQKMLDDIVGNRAAIKDVYGEYDSFIKPFGDEAVAAAVKMVAEGRAGIQGVRDEGRADVVAAGNEVEGDIAELAALIGSGSGARASVTADATDEEALTLAALQEQAVDADRQNTYTSRAAADEATAADIYDRKSLGRQAYLLDLEFKGLEDQARDQLVAARQAAAAAASAARARRSALAAERSAAIDALNQEKFAAMKLSPFEAGQATALGYLQKNASHLDYNRQQLIISTLSNALSEQVRSNNIPTYLKDRGVYMNREETRLVQGAINAYMAGQGYQQERDTGRGPRRAPTEGVQQTRSGGRQ